MPANFSLYLFAFSFFVLAELLSAFVDGYAFKWQVEELEMKPRKYLTFWGNAAMWGDVLVVNPTMAYLLSAHASSWPLEKVFLIFVVVALAGLGLLIPLMKDSRATPSPLFRDGYLTVAGGMHYVYWIVGVSVSVSYYLFTPGKEVAAIEVAIITALLMGHWAVGIMHPPYKVHGKIHSSAWVATILGWITLPILAIFLLSH